MKGPMKNYKTIDDYIADQSEQAQHYLQKLRAIIKEAAPNAVEKLNYKIPAFDLVPNGKRDQQIMMAAYERFISFYPFPTTVEAFINELKPYKTGKGSVQFPYTQELPKELITKMVKYRVAELGQS